MSTKKIVPRADNEGGIGTAPKQWASGYFVTLFKNGNEVAELSSPAFTGNPTAPTQSTGDDSTKLATTAFVHNQIDSDTADAVDGPSSVTDERVAVFDGATGKLLKEAALTIAGLLARANHTGTQLKNTISDFAHASDHQSGGSDEIKLDDLGAPDDNTDLDASSSAHGLMPKLSGNSGEYLDGTGAWVSAVADDYTDADAVAAIAAVLDDTNGISLAYSGGVLTATVNLKAAGLTSIQGELSTDANGVYVKLGTTASTAAAGDDSRIPTQDENDALAGSNGTPSAANPYVTDDDPRVPTTDENDALAGTGTPSAANPYVSDDDSRIPTQDEKDALGGTGTPASGNAFVTEDTLTDHAGSGAPTEGHTVPFQMGSNARFIETQTGGMQGVTLQIRDSGGSWVDHQTWEEAV